MQNHIYLIDYHNLLQNNGLCSYVTQLTKQIVLQKNIQLHIIWANSPVSSKINFETIDNIEHIYLPYDLVFGGKTGDKDVETALFLKEKTGKQKNVIFHFNWINHGAFAFLLKKHIIHCKTILTKHCVPWRDFITSNYSLFFKIHTAFEQSKKLSFILKNKLSNEIYSYKSFDHIITVTHDAQNVLNQLFEISKEKITTIYNGIDLEKFNITKFKQELRKKNHFSENEKIVIFAGTLHPRKGTSELIQAFEKLSERDSSSKYRLIICGKGDYDWIYKQIHQYGQITLTGNLPKEQLYEFYALADVGVVSSYAEQCSYTAIEMMASKLPIVVTDVGGLDEIIDNQSGLKTHIEFTPQKIQFDIDDLVNKIYATITDVYSSKKRAEKAYQKVTSELTAEKMAQQTIQVYQNLLQKSSPNKKTTKNDLVSVVIPCYNAEKYIVKCLQSVLNQIYTNLEIIVIDDASTDKSLEIISKIEDKRLKIIQNKTNKGIVFCLNEGIKVAQGKYIARLDTDDFMQCDRVEKQVAFLSENQEYAMVGSHHILVDEKENVLQYVSFPETYEEIQVFKYFLNPISHPTTMFKSSVFEEFTYSEEYSYCEDYALWFQISNKYKIANLLEFTTFYRIHNESITAKNEEEQQENVFGLILDEFDKIGFELSDEEIKTHSAIITKKGKRYFNSPEKIESLKNWIDKILNFFKIDNKAYKETLLQYCDVWE